MTYSHPLNPAILPLLRHPHTHEPLFLLEDRLIAQESGEAFPVRDGIPSFVISKKTPHSHRLWAWVYNQVAFAYDWGAAVTWKYKLGGQSINRQTYLEKIHIQSEAIVLETAVGTGANIHALPAHAHYIGLDISLNMLRRCQHNLAIWEREVELIHGDAQTLPFAENQFDVVVHMGGLQFIKAPQKALSEALRVTKPGGRIWMIDEAYSIPSLIRRVPEQERTRLGQRQPLSARVVEMLPNIVPPPAVDINAELISNGELYMLSFRKK
ncbi:MAG TPA: methyltransferase domain-containing protein [Anaerolineales bacterium]|nr:methyltransferase domain-containing protein [Anaerolineales bacterium]